MNKHTITTVSHWILIAAGLVLAYEGLTGSDIIYRVFGSLGPAVKILIFGGAAAYVAYHTFMHKKGK